MSNNKKPNISKNKLNEIAQWIHKRSDSQLEVRSGAFKEAATKFEVSRRRIYSIWKEAKDQVQQGLPFFLRNKKKGILRPKKPILIDRIKAIEFENKTTIRDLADELGDYGKTTVGHWVKEKKIKVHTNSVHPQMTDLHKIKRLKFCVSALYFDRNLGVLKFKTMQYTIHIDEKLFFLKKITSRGYLTHCEEIPYRAVENKHYVKNVMFLSAVGRPLYVDGVLIWDEKIGIFPFTVQVPAKRRSKNRPAGTIETKAQTSITMEVFKHALIHRVIPAIKARWSQELGRDIIIQQDNSKSHILDSNPDFRAAASSDGFNIRLVCQPAKSPDLNINDLGWFRSLQSLQVKRKTFNVDQLVERVVESFETLNHTTLNKVFLSLQCYMIEIMKSRGHNNFAAPHMGNDALTRQGILPIDLEVEKTLDKDCLYYLLQIGAKNGLEDLGVFDTGFDLNE